MLNVFFINVRYYCSKPIAYKNVNRMKYLNVAEKNDAAKNIANFLSRGSSRRREGISPYNKIYEFQAEVRGQNSDMVMTSVSGHLMNFSFVQAYKNWNGCNPIQLFDAPVIKGVTEDYDKIKKTLEREVRSCNGLIIWTDCDREGENIGFEIIAVCRSIKTNIPIYRAKFSEITGASVKRALSNLVEPDEKQSQAVDVRSELDLRIGAAFTRFQTLRLQKVFPSQIDQKLVSYGSCQIPTLGFVAQRYKEAENFIPQQFWKLKMSHRKNDLNVDYNWSRNRLFDKQCCEALLMLCQSNTLAKVTNIINKPKNKWRPLPMDTVELEKLGSRKLKINAKQTMTIAEKLYTQGIISYPRTETNLFSNDFKFHPLIDMQIAHPDWGAFAAKLKEWGPNPRKGTKSDQAHPPIHPTKFTTSLSGNEQKVYELIVRHFLACISKDATGSETIVTAKIMDEEFTANGLCIHERNYLEVYPYDKWSSKEIHVYQLNETFEPTELAMNEGSTTAPAMLTEADLIALMEKHGIGTDATHAEHINTIKERGYIGEIERGYLVPGTLGMGLVEGYDAMNLPLAQPKLRADLEKDLKLICNGVRDPKLVLNEQIKKYKEAYLVITEKAKDLDEKMGIRLNELPIEQPQNQHQIPKFDELFKCFKCKQFNMILKQKNDKNGYFISCLGYPGCNNTIWLSDVIKEITTTNIPCNNCGPNINKFNIKFKQQSILGLLNATSNIYTSCLFCNNDLKEILNINVDLTTINSTNRTRTVTNSSNNNSNRSAPPTIPIQTQRTFNNNTNSNNWGSIGQQGNQRTSNWNGGSSTVTIPYNNNNTNQRTNAVNNNNNNWNSKPPNNPTANNWRRNSLPQSNSDDEVTCNKCNGPVKKLTVRKEGPNTGRQFYVCQKPDDVCKFFKWADENAPPTTTNTAGPTSSSSNDVINNWGSGSRSNDGPSTSNSWGTRDNSNNPTKRQRTNDPGTSSTGGGTRRRCGLCRAEGHTKLKCPRRMPDD